MSKLYQVVGQRFPLHPSPACKIGILAVLLMLVVVRTGISQAAADPERGKELFAKRCSGCHAMDQEKEGPRLRGVYGRPAGSIAGFKYSAALGSAHLTWDDASLDKWLSNPDSLIADNDMAFHVPKADERADIIRYLRQSSGR